MVLDSDDLKEWARDAVKELKTSALMMGLWDDTPEEARLEFALQIGYALMQGTPLILVAKPGTSKSIPPKLRAIADVVIEANPNDEAGRVKIQMALRQFIPN